MQGLDIDTSSSGLADSVRQLKNIQVISSVQILIVAQLARLARFTAELRPACVYEEHSRHMDHRCTFIGARPHPRYVQITDAGSVI